MQGKLGPIHSFELAIYNDDYGTTCTHVSKVSINTSKFLRLLVQMYKNVYCRYMNIYLKQKSQEEDTKRSVHHGWFDNCLACYEAFNSIQLNFRATYGACLQYAHI